MRRQSIAALSVFLVFTIGVLAQDQPFRIKVDVALVTVDVIAQDLRGQLVSNLNKADFEVLEDGRPQEIAYFATSETPRNMMLMFDVSGSTNEQRPFMVQACNVFLSLMRPYDRVSLASFAVNFQMLMNWRTMVEGKPREVTMPAVQIGSQVYPSIEDALERFKAEKGRKGLIVMTDGRDTTFFNDIQASRKIVEPEADKYFQGIVRNIRKHGVPLYFIAINTDRNRFPVTNILAGSDIEYTTIEGLMGKAGAQNYLAAVRTRMERLAEATGGRILFPRTLDEVAPLYELIAREFDLSYTLGYAPVNPNPDGKPRRIEVKVVSRDFVRVNQSRDSYTPR
jgi:VWFA-related protein